MTYPLVEVVWEDAVTDLAGWHSLEDLLKVEPTLISSIGYLLLDDVAGYLILIGACSGTDDDWEGGGRQIIPRAMVRAVRRLKDEGKEQAVVNVTGDPARARMWGRSGRSKSDKSDT